MNQSLVTVIITTYNRANCIENSIQSVLLQDYTNWELIIVDDASTDNTADLVENFLSDNRIQYIRLLENSGGAARPKNKALEIAQGDYIATLDSDDFWLPDKLRKQVAVFDHNQEIDYQTCDYYIVQTKTGGQQIKSIPMHVDQLSPILSRDYLGSGSGMIYRKDVFELVGGFEEAIRSCQDWDMRIRLAHAGCRLHVIHEPLVKYIVHGDNMSIHDDLKKREEDVLFVINKHKELYCQNSRARGELCAMLGVWYMMSSDWYSGIKYLLIAILYTPLKSKNYKLLLCALLGPDAFKKINYWYNSKS